MEIEFLFGRVAVGEAKFRKSVPAIFPLPYLEEEKIKVPLLSFYVPFPFDAPPDVLENLCWTEWHYCVAFEVEVAVENKILRRRYKDQESIPTILALVPLELSAFTYDWLDKVENLLQYHAFLLVAYEWEGVTYVKTLDVLDLQYNEDQIPLLTPEDLEAAKRREKQGEGYRLALDVKVIPRCRILSFIGGFRTWMDWKEKTDCLLHELGRPLVNDLLARVLP